VLQDGEYIKIGTNNHRKADVRFIAATNEDLDGMVAKKQFRKDLFYRIRGGWLQLPPLRQRKEDIPLLIGAFLKECGRGGNDGQIGRINEDALGRLTHYDYPGNIRELKSIIFTAVNLAQGKPISVDFLPKHIRKQVATATMRRDLEDNKPILPLAEIEKSHILKAYRLTGCNKSRTAKVLGIGLNTLRRKLEAYGVH
jgi:transcriptional regulator with PAS, ATPase and Fis domain